MIECMKCGVKPAAIAIDQDVKTILCVDCARDSLYEKTAKVPSDINEHFPLLKALATGCDTIVELGMRWARGSTLAFLAAQPKKLISWDLDPECVLSPKVLDLTRIAGATKFNPRVGDSLDIPPERADLVFFDTLHTRKQLLAELMRHADPTARLARKYLVFHDTSTFGRTGEDGSVPGIYAAIRHFQRNESFPLWEVMLLAEVKGLSDVERDGIAEHAEKRRDGAALLNLSNNNGLIVLKYICADGHGVLTANRQCTVCGERGLT